MQQKTAKMICRNCKFENDVAIDELLISNFEQSIRLELMNQLHQEELKLNTQREEYKVLVNQLEKDKIGLDERVNSQVKAVLLTKEDALKESIRKEINEEKSLQLQELEKELLKKSTELQSLNRTKAELERVKRDFEEAETRITLKKELELTERLESAKVTIKEQAQQESFLRIKEREKTIEDLRNKLEDAKRRADQGSMQLQGEIQELEILELLREFHPNDEISQSKKGVNGADVLQQIRTKDGTDCGSIYYESKRTKAFQNDWVKKFKQDNLNTKADILVLVTNALPKEIQRYGIIDGVWICSFNDVKELSLVLRFGLLKLHSVAIKQQGQESKMELLYNYLTSEEFKNVFESIIEGFKLIQDSHSSEKLKMARLWKEREKILERVLLNSTEFYGSLKGIAGNSIPDIAMLGFNQAI